ncbi:MAG TPA: glycosyltransferase family 2 protein [Patescibacteria group bacterium]|nr:glycosyltransferase family 2 protein [Patescibacteria group bacterium]
MIISVAIAIHNEEKNIIRCLSSIYNWIDEIVIVDGASTDHTIEVIKQFDVKHKIKIFHERHISMFHKNKQKAIEQCTGQWIFQLDADEVVSTELKNEIISVLSTLSKHTSMTTTINQCETVAYSLPRLNHFLGQPLRKGGQYPDYTIRLYKNGSVRFPCKTVHEQVELISKKEKNKILTHPLLHYPYPNFREYLRKWIQYSYFEADFLKQHGLKPSLWNIKKYFFVLPFWWFFKTYIRHKGFQDGFAGLVFSLFSSIRFWVIYVALAEKKSAHLK